MSQKYYTPDKLEEIIEDIFFFFGELTENKFEAGKAREYEIRYRFLIFKFHEVMFKDLGKVEYNKAYEHAKQKYDALFPLRDTFSRSRKY